MTNASLCIIVRRTLVIRRRWGTATLALMAIISIQNKVWWTLISGFIYYNCSRISEAHSCAMVLRIVPMPLSANIAFDYIFWVQFWWMSTGSVRCCCIWCTMGRHIGCANRRHVGCAITGVHQRVGVTITWHSHISDLVDMLWVWNRKLQLRMRRVESWSVVGLSDLWHMPMWSKQLGTPSNCILHTFGTISIK